MLNTMIDERYETMPWALFDAVVFDVGNVLLDFAPERFMAEFIPEAWRDAVREHVFRSPYWVAMDHGLLSLEQATERFAARLPEIEAEVRDMMAGWPHRMTPIPEGVAALRLCREKGLKVAILSNYVSEGFRIAEESNSFLREADAMVVSARAGLLKPDPEIYRLLTRRCGASPARTLFVDDSAANVEGALAMGWEALWATSPARVGRFFRARQTHE